MKRILLLCVFSVGFILTVMAQKEGDPPMPTRVVDPSEGLFSTEGLSPSSAFLMLDLMTGKMSDREIKEKYHFVDVDGKVVVSAFVRIDNEEVIPVLADYGVRVIHRYDKILTVQIPLDKFIALAQSKLCIKIDVGNEAKPDLDEARAVTGVNDVYNGFGLGDGFDGTGVVVGIIDVGFEYGHPAFYDSTGTTLRIKRVWDQGADQFNSPDQYNYGMELTTPEQILAAQHSSDGLDETHGTHVAGIAAGCGGNTATGRQYRGVAPNADIVLVATTGIDADVCNAIEYIMSYAESVHKPCVINLSLGHNYGPHDGTSYVSAVSDDLLASAQGVLLVRSAGNNGHQNIHISKALSSENPTLRTMLDFKNQEGEYGTSAGRGYIDIWGSPNESLEVAFFIFNTQNNEYEASSGFYSSALPIEYAVSLSDADDQTMFAHIYCSGNENSNGRQNIYISIDNTIQTDAYQRVGIVIKSTTDNIIHAWGDEIAFVDGGYSMATAGNTDYTVRNEGTGNYVVTVGSYITKGDALTIGTLAPTSSHGPTLDGRTKPDITAPGQYVVAPINRFDSTFSTSGMVAAVNFNDQTTEYYGAMSGTSMATPFVAGVLALCLQENPNLTCSQAIDLLRNTATTDGHTGTIGPDGSNRWGWGKVNAKGMVKALCSPVTPPYFENFEGNTRCWMTDGTGGTNGWVIGSTTNNPGGTGHALYISNDGGTTDGYTVSSASSLVAYRTLQLEVRDYVVSFDWKANGETDYDFLRAALVPTSTNINSVELWNAGTLPLEFIAVDGGNQLVGNLHWTTQTSTVTIPAEGEYNLAFYWRNNGGGGENPGAAIDNVFVDIVSTETISSCDSYTWHETTYTESGDYTYNYTDGDGHPHVEVLHLTINNPVHTATTVSANGMYSWNGTDYFFTSDYTYSHEDENGCTQVDTLHLTVTNPHDRVVEYWFDQRYSNRTATTLDVTSWQTQIDVSSLDIGLHTLYMHLRDSEGQCSPPRTALFYKVFETDAAGAFSSDYICWFDQDYSSQQTIFFADGGTLVDVSQLQVGLHTLNIQVGGGASAELHSYIFYKASYSGADNYGIDYTCWFDQDFASRQTINSANGSTFVEVNQLPDGLHTLNLLIGSGADAELHSYLFYKTSYGTTGAFNMTGTCWFDQNNTLQQSIPFADGITFVDVSQLSDGLHTLNIQLGSGADAELRSFLFYKVSYGSVGGYSMDYTCWFDQNDGDRQSGTLTNGILPLDVDGLSDGLHTLNILIGSGTSAELHSYLFYKVSYDGTAGYSADYTCWFDQRYDGRQFGTLTNGTLLLGTEGLTDGLHVLNMQIGSGSSAELHSYFFYCMPHQLELSDTSTLLYHYAIDGQQRPTLQVTPQNRMIHLELDVADLSIGLHSLKSCLMTGSGSSMALHQAYFYVQPIGGEGLSRYEYWYNDDVDNPTVVDLDPVVDTLQLLTLLDVDTMIVNSSNFDFDPNGGDPIIYPHNSITFRFWNNALRITTATRPFIGQRMVSSMAPDTLERDITKQIAAPGAGQIHWFKLVAGEGDSLVFRADRRCTMQLYAPSGAMVMHASADSVLAWNGFSVWECGVYYLAVHDAQGDGNMSVNYRYFVNPDRFSTTTVTACGSYDWRDSTYTQSGTYTYHAYNDYGCDTTLVLVLTVKPLPNVTISGNSNICGEGSTTLTASGANTYFWNNNSTSATITVSDAGVYTVTGRGGNGCDKTVSKTVSVHPTYVVAVTDSICQGETYDFHGQEITTAGTYTRTLQTVDGCDSVVTLTLTQRTSSSTTFAFDTVVCANMLPIVWHGQVIAEPGTHTVVLQTIEGCDSTLVLTVNEPSFLLGDNFDDGVVDLDKWTYTGNSVNESGGQLMLQQNVTDQDVHLRSRELIVPNNGKMYMDRRFMVHRSSDPYHGKYYYGSTSIMLDGDNNSYVNLEYTYTEYYDNNYHSGNPRNGIYVISKIDGIVSTIRLCDILFDTWLTEHVAVDFDAGTLSYYMDTLVATVTIPGLSSKATSYYNVEFRPYGWWTGHQHYMDWVDIYGDWGVLTTTAASDVTDISAICGGNIVFDGCTEFTANGVCWSKNHHPTLADAHTSDSTGAGAFTSEITGLQPKTTYYVRAYASNSEGTAYGQEVSFTTMGECEVVLTVSSNDTAYGIGAGTGCYAIGDTVAIQAIPTPNTVFLRWSDNDTTNPRNVVVESDTTFTAVFELNLPELHVTSVTHSDFVGGESVSVSWTVQNDGVASTPNGAVWYDRVWLSLESRVAAGDNNPILLGEFPNVSALAPGESYTQTQSFDIPLNIAGAYFLFVISDAYDAHHIYWDSVPQIPYNPPAYIGALSSHCSGGDCGNYAGNKILEISEANDYPAYHDNFFYEMVDIAIPSLPDLKVDSVFPTFQNFFSGTEVGISYQVTNHGNFDTRVSNWTDVVFVSNSPVFDDNAIPIRSVAHHGLLMPDSSYQVFTTVTVPVVMQGTAWFYVHTDYYDQVYEHVGRYNNLTRSDSVNIILTPPADLVPGNIMADNPVSTGATFNFSYEIHNQGAGAPNYGNWLDRCYLSTSAATLENAVLLAEDWHYNGLASGDFYSNSHTVSLPSNMTEGTYFLLVQTDVQNSVFEFNQEENNLFCSGQPITVVRPDLQISHLNAEDTLHAGSEEGVSYYVSNTGDGAVVNKSVTDRVYLSPNAYGTNAIQIAEMSHNLWLNFHDSTLKMLNVTIPGNLQDGDYYLFVSTNVNHSLNESDVDNNRSPLKQVRVLHLPLPDLLITAVEVADTVTAGDTTVMTVTLHNQGDAAVNIVNLSWQLNLSVGTQTFSCVIGDIGNAMETLPAGASVTLQKRVLIPPMTSMASASFGLTVNNSHGVTESNYSNNGYDFSSIISPYLFDLEVTQLALPTETVSGNSVNVSWTVENKGAAPSSSWPMYVRNGSSYLQIQCDQLPFPWHDRIYLSVDSLFDNADFEIGSYAHSNVLDAGESYTASLGCEIPLAADGDYYVLIVSDASAVTFDDQRANNVRGMPISVTSCALPDLQIDTVIAADSVITLDTYQIRYTVSNRGEHATHNVQWTDALYLNSQPSLQGAQQLGTIIHNGLLQVNGSYTDSIQVTIPNLPGGNYYLIVYTDATNQTVEMNGDANNLFMLPVYVTPCALPDLQMDTLVASSAVTTGDSYRIRFTVSNRGEYNTRSNRWTDAFYINSQPDLQGAHHIGSKIHYGLLDTNAYYTDSILVSIPDLSAGDYYFIAYTDATDQVVEMNSDITPNPNNLFVSPVFVSRPLPCDLTVLSLDFPPNATIGEDIIVSWMLQNVGFNPAQGNIKEAVYLSTDSVWSSDDYMLGTVTHAVNLTANSQQQRSAALTLQGVPTGDYYVVVRTNILNGLNESTYANNKAVSLMTLHVDYPSLYIDQEEHRQLNSGQTVYYKLEVGPENEHQTLSCKLIAPSPNVSNGLYIAYSSAPTASNFNFSATVPYVQEQEILIPSLEQGTYYIMATGQTSDNSTQNVTILASIINFEIISVDASSGSNTGSVTTQIIGAKFDTIMDFRLANSNGYLPAEKVFFNNSTESFVTFNLRDQEPGVYDVVAELPGGIITVKGESFVIEEGLPAELLSNIIAPASVRNGNTFTVTIEYGNNGSTDLNVSGFLLVSSNGFPIAFSSDSLVNNQSELTFETAEPNGNPDVIRPGYFATKTIFVRATHTGSINLQLYPIRRQY